MNDLKRELEVATSIAREAGKIMVKYFDGDQDVQIKEDNSQVTIADKLINDLVLKRIDESFPGEGVISEEGSNSEYGTGRKWVCDPIDGTAAYIWGIPTSMFSLALVVDGMPVMGVAYDPFLDRMYLGIKGENSTCNDKPIHVSDKDLESGIMAVTGSVKNVRKDKCSQKLIENKVRIATFSGAVYKCMLIATGRFVGYVEPGLNPHDIAASQVILEGAGGKMTALDGSPHDYTKAFRGVIASNSVVHDALVEYCAE